MYSLHFLCEMSARMRKNEIQGCHRGDSAARVERTTGIPTLTALTKTLGRVRGRQYRHIVFISGLAFRIPMCSVRCFAENRRRSSVNSDGEQRLIQRS